MNNHQLIIETNYTDFVQGDNQLKFQLLAEFHEGFFFAMITQTLDKDGIGYEVKTHFNVEKGVKYFLKWVAKARKNGFNFKNLEIKPPVYSIFSIDGQK